MTCNIELFEIELFDRLTVGKQKSLYAVKQIKEVYMLLNKRSLYAVKQIKDVYMLSNR